MIGIDGVLAIEFNAVVGGPAARLACEMPEARSALARHSVPPACADEAGRPLAEQQRS